MRTLAPGRRRKLTLLQLVAATYLMASGGPFGIEELVQDCGYPLAVALLFVIPLIWSLPVALMVGELSAAIPAEGGFYVWVRRAMGPFWGFQEAWLSLMSSVFDMAVYPTLFVLSLGRIWPPAAQGENGFLIGAAFVVACVAWNFCGARSVGKGSIVLGILLFSPFVVIVGLALINPGSWSGQAAGPTARPDWLAGILVAMWNYMGWDNASTVAAEVEEPQRIYPRVMLLALAAAVFGYVIPIAALWLARLSPAEWATGSWVRIGTLMAGPWLAVVVLLATMVSTLGSFNSLTLSLSRLPLAMAVDGLAPRLFVRQLPNAVPWVSLTACGIAWIAALRLSFDRLLVLDILLYGGSLILEFLALVLLRVREPEMPRPFTAPGGLWGAVLLGLGPAALLAAAAIHSRHEQIGGISAFAVGAAIMALGVVCYGGIRLRTVQVSAVRPPRPPVEP